MSWLHRVWGTVHEPRAVTAIMVVSYALITGVGLATIMEKPQHQWFHLLFGVFMVVGGCVGVPSAWIGLWWVEGPAMSLAAFGASAVSLVDIAQTHTFNEWNAFAFLTTLFLVTRGLRIWGYPYAPWSGKTTQTQRDQAKTAVWRKEIDDALNG